MRYVCTFTYQIIIIYDRQKTSGAEGERLKEAASINKSLSTLGYTFTIIDICFDFVSMGIVLSYLCFLIMQLIFSDLACSHVIMILVDVANGKQRHIPYRDSRLTFLLQVDYLLASFDILILMMSFILFITIFGIKCRILLVETRKQ